MIDKILSIAWNCLKKLWFFHRRPRLQIYFDANESYHTRQLVNLGVQAFYCHVMVKNIGKDIAMACRARLIEVAIPESGRLVRYPDFQPSVTLKWGHEPDFHPRDIEPDLPRLLDVCCVFEPRPDTLSFAPDKSPCGIRTDFPRGIYVVTIRCDGKNLTPSDAQFVIRHLGAWNETRVEPFDGKNVSEAVSKLTNQVGGNPADTKTRNPMDMDRTQNEAHTMADKGTNRMHFRNSP